MAREYQQRVRAEVQPVLKMHQQHTEGRLARLKEAGEEEGQDEEEGGSASKGWLESEGVVQHAAFIGIDEARLRRLPPLVRRMLQSPTRITSLNAPPEGSHGPLAARGPCAPPLEPGVE